MKPIWTIAHEHHLVVATLEGVVTRAAIEACLATIDGAGVAGYRRILDLSLAMPSLGAADLGALAAAEARASAALSADAPGAGGLALVVLPAFHAGFVGHLRRLGDPSHLQVFAATREAREWLTLLSRLSPRH